MILITPFTAFAPHSAAPGSSNHLDPVDILEQRILHIPVDAGKEGRVDTPPVDQHEQFVGEKIIEAAAADRPVMGIHTGDIQTRSEPQRFGNAAHSGSAELLVGNHVDGCGRIGEALASFRDGGHGDVQELFDAHFSQLTRRLRRLGSRDRPLECDEGRDKDEGNRGVHLDGGITGLATQKPRTMYSHNWDYYKLKQAVSVF
jgi:hypothetical protein